MRTIVKALSEARTGERLIEGFELVGTEPAAHDPDFVSRQAQRDDDVYRQLGREAAKEERQFRAAFARK